MSSVKPSSATPVREPAARPKPDGDRSPHHLRPVLIVLAFLIPMILLTLYFSGESQPTQFVPSNILMLALLNVDVILLVVLILLLSRNLVKAYFERRQRLLGSGFRTKLIAAFVGFTLIPSLLLVGLASGLLSKSIDNWFGQEVEHALKDSQDVAQAHRRGHEAVTVNAARAISREIYADELLAEALQETLEVAMQRKRMEYGVSGVEVYSATKQLLTRSVDPNIPLSDLNAPEDRLVENALAQGEVKTFQFIETGDLIRAAVTIPSALDPSQVAGVVVVDTYLPEALVKKMDRVSQSYRNFKEAMAFRDPIKAQYISLVLGIALVIILSGTWFGFQIAKGITVPIQRLAEGTKAIAAGDLSFRINVRATDEIGVLVDSFNRMTKDLQASKLQLEQANTSLQQSNLELERRRAYTETVLDNIGSGVVSVDAVGRITTFNHSAERILGLKGEKIRGVLLNDVFKPMGLEMFTDLVERIRNGEREALTWEGDAEVGGGVLVLGLNGSRLRDDRGQSLGAVVVFEDLSALIKAQKAAAWQEVAQRIAHEIKNPLTPIQLSAERLRKKFFEGAPDFNDIVDQSTQTIVKEVSGLKRLVDEFSKFARMPLPVLARQSPHDVLHEVITLYKGAHRDIEFVTRLDEPLPPIMMDREQLRRVFVNLFDNAIHAMNGKGCLWVTTRHEARDGLVVIEVADEGVGIQPGDQDKLFLPYFSKRKTGTGLGLAIVHRIILDHNGRIRAANRAPKGAIFTIELPV
ncbi:MAG TPA: ATP-binding protein [Nitrospirales bacterium]|nr:ATP-binding protein [Nitrospirales bacterium]